MNHLNKIFFFIFNLPICASLTSSSLRFDFMSSTHYSETDFSKAVNAGNFKLAVTILKKGNQQIEPFPIEGQYKKCLNLIENNNYKKLCEFLNYYISENRSYLSKIFIIKSIINNLYNGATDFDSHFNRHIEQIKLKSELCIYLKNIGPKLPLNFKKKLETINITHERELFVVKNMLRDEISNFISLNFFKINSEDIAAMFCICYVIKDVEILEILMFHFKKRYPWQHIRIIPTISQTQLESMLEWSLQKKEQLKCFKALIDHTLSNKVVNNGMIILCLIRYGNNEHLEHLLKAGYDPNDQLGSSLVAYAIEAHNPKGVETLLKQGAICPQNSLSHAIATRSINSISTLIDSGANYDHLYKKSKIKIAGNISHKDLQLISNEIKKSIAKRKLILEKFIPVSNLNDIVLEY